MTDVRDDLVNAIGMGSLGRIEEGRIEDLVKKLPDGVETCLRPNKTPIFFAIQQMSLESVNLLIRLGADVNATNAVGETPLFFAPVFPDTPDAFTGPLLAAGADLWHRDKRGWTALVRAISNGSVERTSHFLDLGLRLTPDDLADDDPIELARVHFSEIRPSLVPRLEASLLESRRMASAPARRGKHRPDPTGVGL